jgi:hypothetical protein
LVVILSALVFLWPAVVNGGPFLFSDSVQYTRGPDGALGKVFGAAAKSAWSPPRPTYAGVAQSSAEDAALASTPRAGRSIYYGVLANLGARIGGEFWLTLFLQALAGVYTIDLMCRAMGWTRLRTYGLAVAAGAVLTPYAVYACFIMPDVFAAVMVAAAAALAAGAERLTRTDLVLATALIAYSTATHTSHLAVLAAIIAAAGLLWLIRSKAGAGRRSAALLAGAGVVCLAAAIGAGAAYDLAVKKAFKQDPIKIPFLSARMASDPFPGEAWLKRRCPQAGFVVCKFASRLPMSSNDFIWSADPVRSVFTTASAQDQIGLGKEQTRFFLAVTQEEPLQVARAFAAAWIDQLDDFSLEGMNVVDEQRIYIDPLVAERFRPKWHRTLAYRQLWPTDPLTLALAALQLLSVTLILGVAVKAGLRRGADPQTAEAGLLSAALVVVAGVLANAAACGGFSGVFGRYEARVVAPLILTGGFALALLVGDRPAPAAA